MGWTDRFWTASNWVLDTAIHAVADTMHTCGSLACTLGGVGFAVSNVLPEQKLNTAYYGALNAEGTFNLGVNVTNFGFGFNESLPLSFSDDVNNGMTYSLTDYIRADIVRMASTVTIASGIVLRALSANINKWQQSREERRDYEARNGIKMSSPHFKEYLLVSAKSVTGSVTTTLISHSIAAALLHFSDKADPKITYPPKVDEDGEVEGEYYSGPILSVPFSLKFSLGESAFNISLPFGNLNVLINKAVDVVANATYGGGFFLKSSKEHLALTESVSTTLGATTYLASTFFARKEKQLYDQRIRHAEEKISSSLVLV